MKVALIIERIETWRGGAETSTMQFAGHLARLGCEVHIVTGTYMPSTPDVRIVPIHVGRFLKSWRTLLFARRAAAHVRAADYDIVHAITPCLDVDVYQPRGGTVPEMLARNLAICPTNGRRALKRAAQWFRLKYHMLKRLERRLLNRRPPPAVIAISRYVTDQLDRHYAFDSDRIHEIFNGIDPDEADTAQRREDRQTIRRHYGLDDDDLVLLCVANNFKLKGVARAIEALRVLEDGAELLRSGGGKAKLVVVGGGNPVRYVRLADRLGLADRVVFAGTSDRTWAFFHAADMLLHPTYYDPCSRVVLEALSAGLPVITTRFNGAAERIQDGIHGYVVDAPGDVEAIADRVRRLNDDTHRHACARQAATAVEGISMREHADRAHALYRTLLHEKSSTQGGGGS